jgi:hypothetical protein
VDKKYLEKILKLTKTTEAMDRKKESLKQCRIYEGKIRQYVVEMLEDFFSRDTVKEMPKASSFKVAKKIIQELAILYNENPERTFSGLNDDQLEKIKLLMEDSNYPQLVKKAYEYFKLQGQSNLYIVPKKGKLKIRALKQHSLDIIPDKYDSEEAAGYVVGTGVFNSENYINNRPENKPIQTIHPSGTPSLTLVDKPKTQGKSEDESFVVWTEQENFLMNGLAEIESEETENILSVLDMPIKMPFVDVAYPSMKDGSYFVDMDSSVTDFNIEYCFGYSLLLYTMIMQNFSLPVFSGLKELMPENLQISPNRPIFLPKDQQGNGLSLEFVTPSPNLEATKGIQDSMLNTFLSIEGIDPKSVVVGQNQTQGYSSGYERLMAMVDKFESARDDIEIMKVSEHRAALIVAQWMNAARMTDGLLEEKYIPNSDIDLESFAMEVNYKMPEARLTKQEILDYNIKALDAGMKSMIKAYMEVNEIKDEERAKAELMEVARSKIGSETTGA